jgi:hypothetical protein
VRTREELANDADDGSVGPVRALDARDLELLEVGEVVGLGGRGEVGEAVVPVLAVGGGEERAAASVAKSEPSTSTEKSLPVPEEPEARASSTACFLMCILEKPLGGPMCTLVKPKTTTRRTK